MVGTCELTREQKGLNTEGTEKVSTATTEEEQGDLFFFGISA